MKKIKWGILSTSNFAIQKIIPALKYCKHSELVAITSRDINNAKQIAKQNNISIAYGSYEELLKDTNIDAIYIPLPNHMHTEWSIKVMNAGKHVLCEKPLALNTADIQLMIDARNKNKVKAGEAFMVKTHPQHLKVKDIIQQGELGEIKMIHGFFSYYNTNPENIRNIAEFGGGSLRDIGCYPTTLTRFYLNEEPTKVMGLIEKDHQFGTDKMASVIFDFTSIQASFTCSTQLVPYQRMQVYGTKKMLEVIIPFNAPNDTKCFITINDGDLLSKNIIQHSFDICDQYTIEFDTFSLAIIENKEVPSSFEDAYNNVAVIEAIFRSSKSGKWEDLKLLK